MNKTLLDISNAITGTWFNTAASFVAPPTVTANGTNVFTRIGTLGPNQVYGPGLRSADVSLHKNFQLTEGYVLELHVYESGRRHLRC